MGQKARPGVADDQRSTAYAHTLARQVQGRLESPDAVLNDELERLIAVTVSAGWRPWRRRRCRLLL